MSGDRDMNGAVLFAKLMKALAAGDTAFDLAESTGLAYCTVRRYCRALHDAKLVYIDNYAMDVRGARTRAVFKLTLTPRPDHRGYRRKTDARRCAEYRDRNTGRRETSHLQEHLLGKAR